MSAPDVLIVIALALGVIEELDAKGRSLLGWGLILIAVALLWGHVMEVV